MIDMDRAPAGGNIRHGPSLLFPIRFRCPTNHFPVSSWTLHRPANAAAWCRAAAYSSSIRVPVMPGVVRQVVGRQTDSLRSKKNVEEKIEKKRLKTWKNRNV